MAPSHLTKLTDLRCRVSQDVFRDLWDEPSDEDDTDDATDDVGVAKNKASD
jgi:hypothetical protein